LANAQNIGQNTVYNPSGATVSSTAFIEARVFAGIVSSPTFCKVLNYILMPSNHILPLAGAVIDSGGVAGTNYSFQG
jgi:hypothetical protein